MPFSPEVLKGSVYPFGLARPNRFLTIIQPPFIDLGILNIQTSCEESALPGRGIATQERTTFGPPRKVAYNSIYDDITLGFICTGAMRERVAFDRWQTLVQDPQSNYVSYYDTYVGNIAIIEFNEIGVPIYGVTLREAYPTRVNEQTLSWDETDTYLKLSVTFAYHKWLSVEQAILGQFGDFVQGDIPDVDLNPGDDLGNIPFPGVGDPLAGNVGDFRFPDNINKALQEILGNNNNQ